MYCSLLLPFYVDSELLPHCILPPPSRMRTQTAAGCCSVRRIWSPCSPSSRSSSSIHTCWAWASRVGESVFPSFCLLVSLIHCMNWHTSFHPGVYEPVSCSSQKIMRVFGFASSLIEILALGLQTYNRARYRQLVKRIGHIIRSVQQSESTQLWIQYMIVENHNVVSFFFPQNDSVLCQWPLGPVCEFNWCWWVRLTLSVFGKTTAGIRPSLPQSCSTCAQKQKVQPPVSILTWTYLTLGLFLNLFSVLLSHRLGIWLFMSEMPYGTLSSSMLWRVLYVMQCAETAGLETFGTASDTHSCIQALRGTSIPALNMIHNLKCSNALMWPHSFVIVWKTEWI